MKRRWLGTLLTAPLVLALGLTAVPSAASASSSSGSGVLTISNESGSLWPCSFNPYNQAVWGTTVGFFYEPLVYVNTLENGKATPWLATSWAWSDNNKVVSFTIRKGVKWSDGVPMTAADVVFTYNLLKQNPALDLNAIWSVLKSVTQSGDNVVLTFKTTAVPYFYYVADQIDVLPQHVWASVKNAVTYTDASPVGTGPYVLSKCTGQNITYTANPNYWQPGLPKVKTIEYPAFTSNTPANEELATGVAQLGAQFIPNIKAFYTSKSSDYHYWFPPISDVDMFINLTVAPLNDLAVRQAMAYAIDRPRVSEIGEYGYEPPSDQAAIVTPTFKSWLDSSLMSKYNYAYNPAKATSILEKDGYKKGSNGIMAKDGKQLSFTIINVGGNSDWVAAVQVIASELAQVGIKITPDNLTGTDFDQELYTGKYQLGYNMEVACPNPFYELRQILYSGNTAPIGKLAATNWERYSSAHTDGLIDQYAATTSSATQHSIVDQLQQVMLSEVPVIPMTEEVDWYQYDTGAFSGWVTPQNPYAQPAIYQLPDDEQLLLHLVPK